MSHILGPHNIFACIKQAMGCKTTTDVDDTLFQQSKNTGNYNNNNNNLKKPSCTITAATMHFYLLYNWIIFFICHARIQKPFSWLIPWHNLKENRNVMSHYICAMYHMQPRVFVQVNLIPFSGNLFSLVFEGMYVFARSGP